MSKCYMMIGVPGSGKSTYIQNVLNQEKNLISISTDEYIEKIAREQNSTYSSVYDTAIKDANNWFNEELRKIFKQSTDFVWDQTNINIKSRKFKLKQLFDQKYEVHAITFEVETSIILDRLRNRATQTGKIIPESIIQSMLKSYQPPILDEGFSTITTVNSLGDILSHQKKHTSLKI